MKKVLMFAIVLLAIAIVGYVGIYKYYSVPADTFKGWHTSLQACLQDAAARNVPAMIKLTAKGWLMCRRLEAVTLSKPEINAFNDRFSFGSLEYFSNKQEVESFHPGLFPVIVFLTPDKKELRRLKGFYTVEALVKEMQAVLDGLKQPPQPTKEPEKQASVSSEGWLTTLAEGKKQAATAKKPLLAKIGASWWGGCVQLDAVLHSNNQELQKVLKQFVLVKLESEAPEVAQLNVEYIPLMIFYSSDGKELSRHVGALAAPELIELLNKQLAQ